MTFLFDFYFSLQRGSWGRREYDWNIVQARGQRSTSKAQRQHLGCGHRMCRAKADQGNPIYLLSPYITRLKGEREHDRKKIARTGIFLVWKPIFPYFFFKKNFKNWNYVFSLTATLSWKLFDWHVQVNIATRFDTFLKIEMSPQTDMR